jgi:hypothetical protein
MAECSCDDKLSFLDERAGQAMSRSLIVFLFFSNVFWVIVSEAWGSRIGRRPTPDRS